MGTTLNPGAYAQLINDDLTWLAQQPRTLEREHIERVLIDAKEHYPIREALIMLAEAAKQYRFISLNPPSEDIVKVLNATNAAALQLFEAVAAVERAVRS